MRRGERRKGWRKFWKNDDKKTDEMDRKECRKMMKTNKGRRWKMKKSVGWGVCMKQFICGARPSTTTFTSQTNSKRETSLLHSGAELLPHGAGGAQGRGHQLLLQRLARVDVLEAAPQEVLQVDGRGLSRARFGQSFGAREKEARRGEWERKAGMLVSWVRCLL